MDEMREDMRHTPASKPKPAAKKKKQAYPPELKKAAIDAVVNGTDSYSAVVLEGDVEP